jgi:hypothetical protein
MQEAFPAGYPPDGLEKLDFRYPFPQKVYISKNPAKHEYHWRMYEVCGCYAEIIDDFSIQIPVKCRFHGGPELCFYTKERQKEWLKERINMLHSKRPNNAIGRVIIERRLAESEAILESL